MVLRFLGDQIREGLPVVPSLLPLMGSILRLPEGNYGAVDAQLTHCTTRPTSIPSVRNPSSYALATPYDWSVLAGEGGCTPASRRTMAVQVAAASEIGRE